MDRAAAVLFIQALNTAIGRMQGAARDDDWEALDEQAERLETLLELWFDDRATFSNMAALAREAGRPHLTSVS